MYALDATTIDLCLSMFPWARFRSTKAAVKLHTLLDLQGAIPSFVHISDGKLHDVNVLDLLVPEPGAIYLMDRAYVRRLPAVLSPAPSRRVLRHPGANNLDARRCIPGSATAANGILSDHLVRLGGRSTPEQEANTCAGSAFATRRRTGCDQLYGFRRRSPSGNLYRSRLARRTVLQMDHATSAHQATSENGRQDPALDRRVRLCPAAIIRKKLELDTQLYRMLRDRFYPSWQKIPLKPG